MAEAARNSGAPRDPGDGIDHLRHGGPRLDPGRVSLDARRRLPDRQGRVGDAPGGGLRRRSRARSEVPDRSTRRRSDPELSLVVDTPGARGIWDVETAIERLHEWEPFDLRWVEQPLPPADLSGYARLRAAAAVPVGTGEDEWGPESYGACDQRRLRRRRADGSRPVSRPHRRLRVISMCEAAGIKYSAHSWSGALNTAASLHLLAISEVPTRSISSLTARRCSTTWSTIPGSRSTACSPCGRSRGSGSAFAPTPWTSSVSPDRANRDRMNRSRTWRSARRRRCSAAPASAGSRRRRRRKQSASATSSGRRSRPIGERRSPRERTAAPGRRGLEVRGAAAACRLMPGQTALMRTPSRGVLDAPPSGRRAAAPPSRSSRR